MFVLGRRSPLSGLKPTTLVGAAVGPKPDRAILFLVREQLY